MFSILLSAVLFWGSQSQAAISESDLNYFSIGSVEVTEIPQPSFQILEEPLCESSESPDLGRDGFQPKSDGIQWDQIVNIGQKIWSIVEKNQPVVNMSVQKAEALPLGINSWADLECWQMPESRLYRVTYKNLYGMSVVDLTFRLNYTHGGRINGMGRYLSQVTVLPAQVDVLWGFTLDANVKVANVTNAGTRTNPVAGIQLDVNWTVKTPFKYSESTESFFVRGDGLYRQLN